MERIKESAMRAAIIEAGTKLFRKFGYDKLTMEDIAKSIDKGRSTIYLYFRNKEDLLDSILNIEVGSYLTDLEQEIPSTANAEEQIKLFCSIKFGFIKNKTDEYLILSGEIMEHPMLMLKVRALFEAREVAVLKRIIIAGIQQKVFSELKAEKIDLFAVIMVNTMHEIIDRFWLKNQSVNFALIEETVQMILLKSLK